MAYQLKDKLIIVTAVLYFVMELTGCDRVVIWPTEAITSEPTSVSQACATLNGLAVMDEFINAGFEYGATTEYGNSINEVEYNTRADNYTSINCRLKSFSPGTTYHYRLKIESSRGIIYGDDVSFTTSGNSIFFNPALNYGSVSDIDGNTYKTIQIGAQTWMAENLKTTKFNTGASIRLVSDYKEWWLSDSAAYCWVNNDGAAFKDTYGAFYNWRAVNSNKLCPLGWHVPGDAEWSAFTSYLGGPLNMGYKIKEAGSTHWLGQSTSITNESGFTALPASYRNFDGSFRPSTDDGFWRGDEAFWWSSSAASAGLAYYWDFYSNSNTLLWGSWRIEMGLSVRCLKDN